MSKIVADVSAVTTVGIDLAKHVFRFTRSMRYLAELGLITAQGTGNMRGLGALIHEGDPAVPDAVRASLMPLVAQIVCCDEAIKAIDADIAMQAKADPVSNRLMTIPGIDPVTALALVVTIGDPAGFSGPRKFAAFLGLVPRQHSSGGKAPLGRLTKMGNATCASCWW